MDLEEQEGAQRISFTASWPATWCANGNNAKEYEQAKNQFNTINSRSKQVVSIVMYLQKSCGASRGEMVAECGGVISGSDGNWLGVYQNIVMYLQQSYGLWILKQFVRVLERGLVSVVGWRLVQKLIEFLFVFKLMLLKIELNVE